MQGSCKTCVSKQPLKKIAQMLWGRSCDGISLSRRMSVSVVASDREIGIGMTFGRRDLPAPQPQHASKVHCAN
ncbi:hypothetical protein AXF42_Ash019442 [Apostasia shenzhenica]|uniref:Uncharacterized protein n=1 Tax=Apostasia shenzhenica TaxID=1088818 RepID=A0A2I0AYE9_9ASPA|nr:hypothetical protein AXF42_Ash019442 [Apostasia shenzhenica]